MAQQRTQEPTEAEMIQREIDGIHTAWDRVKRTWRFDGGYRRRSTLLGLHRTYYVDFEQQFGLIDGRSVARVIGKVTDRDLQVEFGPFDVIAPAAEKAR